MMKTTLKISLMAASAGLMFSCGSQKSEVVTNEMALVEDAKTPTLTMLWETPETLMTNESVLFDAATGTIYVANMEGDATVKDGKGSISIIGNDGSIINQNWITGLNAPKGMGITDGKLYVTDIDELVEIDMATAKVSNKYKVEGAQFLNDTDTHDGKVYFTDMNTGKVHMLDAGVVSTISEGNQSINGIAISADGTIFGLDGSGMKQWNADGTTTVLNSAVTGGDGLVILGDGNFIASRWQGEIWFATADGETLMLDTKGAESNTADIGYNSKDQIVYVPTFFKNKVVAYKLDY
jgi:hypothetical protein